MGEITMLKSELTSSALPERDRHVATDPWLDVRCGVWYLASELYILEDLQKFAKVVDPTFPLDIKQTADILARAQLELRELINNLYSPSRRQKRLV